MPQVKISTFFKPCSNPCASNEFKDCDHIELSKLNEETDVEAPTVFKCHDHKPGCESDKAYQLEGELSKESNKPGDDPALYPSRKFFNKKRTYIQYYLEFGQSDFLLHTCSTCGMKYARGVEEDEKAHRTFHSEFYEGIHFKGWRHERVVSWLDGCGDRIVLVLGHDPLYHKKKVDQVVKMMDRDMGTSDNTQIHDLCQVYLYVSGGRVVGCLVVEPIRRAHRVVSNTADDNLQSPKTPSRNLSMGSRSSGEIVKKAKRQHDLDYHVDIGALLFEEQTFPAVCGIKAIWVLQRHRRKGIATSLLDIARKSFKPGEVIQTSQCAFSPTTSAGRSLASWFSGTASFLIYMEEDAQFTDFREAAATAKKPSFSN